MKSRLCCPLLLGVLLGCQSQKAEAPKAEPAPVGETPRGAMVVQGEIGRYGGQLRLSLQDDPHSLHPLLTTNNDLVYGTIFSHCWNFNPISQQGEPGLCERYERSPDGLQYLFTLREGLRWSDGHPLTADDFAFTYEALLDPTLEGAQRDWFRQSEESEEKALYPRLEVIDDRHFRFTLHRRDAMFHYTVGNVMVIPRHIWEERQKAGHFEQAFHPSMPANLWVSSGPFVIKEIVPGHHVLLERNPYYWRVDGLHQRLPYLDSVLYTIIQDPSVSVQRFLDGSIDLIEVRSEFYAQLKQREERDHLIVRDLGSGFTTNYLMFNLDPRSDASGRPYVDPIKLSWFQNVQFRKAIAYALDRESMVRIALQGKGQPLWAYYTPANKVWSSERVIRYPYSLEKARQILKDEGFTWLDGQLHDPEGHPVRFSLTTQSENPTRIQFLNIIQENLSRLGIEIELRPMPFHVIKRALATTRDFDAVILGWIAGIPPDPAMAKNVLLSKGAAHFWSLGQKTPQTPWEARIDLLMMRCTDEIDQQARKQAFDEIQYIFSDKLPLIQLVVHNTLVAARSNVKAFSPSLLPPILQWNIDQLYLAAP